MPRWIDNRIVKQSAWTYHKFDNARGSDYARAGCHGDNREGAGRYSGGWCQVGAMTVEIGHGAIHHDCSVDDVMKGQAK